MFIVEAPALGSGVDDELVEPQACDAEGGRSQVEQIMDVLSDNSALLGKGLLPSFKVPEVNAFGQEFRTYDQLNERSSGVEEFYRLNHINQTHAFVQEMRAKHLQFNKAKMGIWEACELLNEFVDESDPDLDMPQIEHLLQTAEAIRKAHPTQDWFHLVGLIHDLGKVLLHHKFGSEPQWAVVGDTFPVGCAFNQVIVHSEFFKGNPDSYDDKFCSKLGIYEPGCGLDKVLMSWGHDEYLYQVMKHNKRTLPPQALFVARFHSFYALHRDEQYEYLLDDADRRMIPWLKEFNKYDLYSKSSVRVDVEAVKPYYMALIQKYFPDELSW